MKLFQPASLAACALLAAGTAFAQAGPLALHDLPVGKPLRAVPECARTQAQGTWTYVGRYRNECIEWLVPGRQPPAERSEIHRIYLPSPPALSKGNYVNLEVDNGGTLMHTVIMTKGLASQAQDLASLITFYGQPAVNRVVTVKDDGTGKTIAPIHAEWTLKDGSMVIFWGRTADIETGGVGIYSAASTREIMAERKRDALKEAASK
ncbi:MAG: hypothetical protein V4679_12825 [Pseudomonadota bacterium]